MKALRSVCAVMLAVLSLAACATGGDMTSSSSNSQGVSNRFTRGGGGGY